MSKVSGFVGIASVSAFIALLWLPLFPAQINHGAELKQKQMKNNQRPKPRSGGRLRENVFSRPADIGSSPPPTLPLLTNFSQNREIYMRFDCCGGGRNNKRQRNDEFQLLSTRRGAKGRKKAIKRRLFASIP